MIDINKEYEGFSDLVYSNELERFVIEIWGDRVFDEFDYLNWDILQSESQAIEKLLTNLGYINYILESDNITITIKFT